MSNITSWTFKALFIFELAIITIYIALKFGLCSAGGLINPDWGYEALIINWIFDRLKETGIMIYNEVFPRVVFEDFEDSNLSKARPLINSCGSQIRDRTSNIATLSASTLIFHFFNLPS